MSDIIARSMAANNSNQIGILSGLVYNIKDAKYGAKGDGVADDTGAIQAAIDAAYNAGGGTVIIPPSFNPFIIANPNGIILKTNVTLKSLGGILKRANNVCMSSSTAYYLVQNQNGQSYGFYSNVTLDGLIIDANCANNSSYQVADSITIGGENVVVKNCRIYNVVDSGIMFSDATNSLCIDNRIDGTTSTTCDDGIYVNDGDGAHAYENVISGNRITGFRNSGIALKRILQRTVVSENTVYNCGDGITLENASTSTDYSLNISIVNNRLRYIGYINASAAWRGIDLRQSNYCQVTNNRIEDCKGTNIFVEGSSYCTIANNIISCTTNADPTSNDGIYLINRDSLGCNYNVIKGNIITTPQHRGIWLSGTMSSQYNQIEGNIVQGAVNRGLRVEAVFTNNVISENTVGGDFDIEIFAGANNNKFINNTLLTGNVTGNIDQTNQVSYLLLGTKRVSVGTVAPTTGTWAVGDVVWNTTPAASGNIGWVCTTAGTPGTWKTFGNIGA